MLVELEVVVPVVIGLIGIFREFIKIIQQFIKDDVEDKEFLRRELEKRDIIIAQLRKELKDKEGG